METKLNDLYAKMLKEGMEGTVNTKKVTPSSGKPANLEDADKAQGKAMSKDSGPDANVKVDKPTEGPSETSSEGKPTVLAGSKDVKKDSENPTLSFDQLFKTIITEEEGVVPSHDVEGSDFDENTGDFASEEAIEGDETGEEIDVATEIRMLANRMLEIADSLSTGEDMEEPTDILAPDEELGVSEDESSFGKPMGESVKNEPNPKPLKKTGFNPKMSLKAKSKIGTSGAKTAAKPAVKDRQGTLSLLSPSKGKTLQSGTTASGNGPSVKGGNAPLVQ